LFGGAAFFAILIAAILCSVAIASVGFVTWVALNRASSSELVVDPPDITAVLPQKSDYMEAEALLATTELEAVRSRFPIFRNKIYLNSCSQGALSDAVEASLHEHIRTWHEDGSPWDKWMDHYEAARAAFARFINAKTEEVAILSCASAGISAIASALDFNGPRRKVVMGEFEFPTMGKYGSRSNLAALKSASSARRMDEFRQVHMQTKSMNRRSSSP
jgi:kynureninase